MISILTKFDKCFLMKSITISIDWTNQLGSSCCSILYNSCLWGLELEHLIQQCIHAHNAYVCCHELELVNAVNSDPSLPVGVPGHRHSTYTTGKDWGMPSLIHMKFKFNGHCHPVACSCSVLGTNQVHHMFNTCSTHIQLCTPTQAYKYITCHVTSWGINHCDICSWSTLSTAAGAQWNCHQGKPTTRFWHMLKEHSQLSNLQNGVPRQLWFWGDGVTLNAGLGSYVRGALGHIPVHKLEHFRLLHQCCHRYHHHCHPRASRHHHSHTIHLQLAIETCANCRWMCKNIETYRLSRWIWIR